MSFSNRSDTVSACSTERVYSNSGNLPLISLISGKFGKVLDVGCGAGDNAALIRSIDPRAELYGVTRSSREAELAGRYMTYCWVSDAESSLPEALSKLSFDVIVFSHVLEHFREPADVLSGFSKLLRPGGVILIAVPNIVSWKMRLEFLTGSFEYDSAGPLDDTHLRFFTYHSADKYLLSKTPELTVVDKLGDGSVPLWWLRRYVFPRRLSEYLDKYGSRCCPNLFAGQVLIKAVKK